MKGITITEIARLANVSKATVSRVINNKDGVGEETRIRIRKIIEDLGGGPIESGLTRLRSKILGVMLPDITNPFFAELAKVLALECEQYGYSILLSVSDNDVERELRGIRMLVSKLVDGFFLVSNCAHAMPGHQILERYNIPCILLDRQVTDLKRVASVLNDNTYATYMCCVNLIRSGSTDIVFIGENNGLSTSFERIEGYKAALTEYGLEYREEYVFPGDFGIDSGYKAIVEMEKTGLGYTSVVASNDLTALGAIRALQEFGYRIPEDMQVMGFDNIAFSQYVTPQLSTVQQPCVSMGKKAVKLMIDYLELDTERQRKVEPTVVRLQPKLLKRGTTLNTVVIPS